MLVELEEGEAPSRRAAGQSAAVGAAPRGAGLPPLCLSTFPFPDLLRNRCDVDAGSVIIFRRQRIVMERALTLKSEWLFHLSALKVSKWAHFPSRWFLTVSGRSDACLTGLVRGPDPAAYLRVAGMDACPQ